MSDNPPTAPSSIGFPGLLTILFIGLKLTNVITWPWVWVISPLWIALALVIFAIILLVIINVIIGAFK